MRGVLLFGVGFVCFFTHTGFWVFECVQCHSKQACSGSNMVLLFGHCVHHKVTPQVSLALLWLTLEWPLRLLSLPF